MSLLGVNLNDIPDLKVVPEGEHQLRAEEVVVKVSGQNAKHPGESYYSIRYKCLDVPGSTGIFDSIFLPNGEDVEKDNAKLRRIRDLVVAFGLSPNKKGDVDLEVELPGKTGFAITKLGTDLNGDSQAQIKKFCGKKK